MKAVKPQPQFLRIRWEDTSKQGAVVTLEAMACLRHRWEIALAYASARGAGGRGDACDFCEDRIFRASQASYRRLPMREPLATRLVRNRA
jgi:hypothetical protein